MNFEPTETQQLVREMQIQRIIISRELLRGPR